MFQILQFQIKTTARSALWLRADNSFLNRFFSFFEKWTLLNFRQSYSSYFLFQLALLIHVKSFKMCGKINLKSLSMTRFGPYKTD